MTRKILSSHLHYKWIYAVVFCNRVRFELWSCRLNSLVPPFDERWMWTIGGMIICRQNFCVWKEIWPNALSPTINPTWKALGSNWSMDGENPANDHLSYDLHLCLSTMPRRQFLVFAGTRCKRLKATNSLFSREGLIFYGFCGNFLISLSSELQIQLEVSRCFHILCRDNDVGGGMKQIMKNVKWTTWKKREKE